VYLSTAEKSISPSIQYNARIAPSAAGALPWDQPSCSTRSGSLPWWGASSCALGCGPPPPLPVTSRSRPPSPPAANAPARPTRLRACRPSPPVRWVRKRPWRPRPRLLDGRLRCPRPPGVRVPWTPPRPCVPRRRVPIAVGWGWATCGRPVRPRGGQGASGPATAATALCRSLIGPSGRAHGSRWHCAAAAWQGWLKAGACARRLGGSRAPPPRCGTAWGKPPSSGGPCPAPGWGLCPCARCHLTSCLPGGVASKMARSAPRKRSTAWSAPATGWGRPARPRGRGGGPARLVPAPWRWRHACCRRPRPGGGSGLGAPVAHGGMQGIPDSLAAPRGPGGTAGPAPGPGPAAPAPVAAVATAARGARGQARAALASGRQAAPRRVRHDRGRPAGPEPAGLSEQDGLGGAAHPGHASARRSGRTAGQHAVPGRGQRTAFPGLVPRLPPLRATPGARAPAVDRTHPAQRPGRRPAGAAVYASAGGGMHRAGGVAHSGVTVQRAAVATTASARTAWPGRCASHGAGAGCRHAGKED